MTTSDLINRVDAYYSGKLREHGPTARGVDWNSPESQTLRFEQLLTVCDLSRPFSINDFGCGYGALIDHLSALGASFDYTGYDVSAAMIEEARRRHIGRDFVADATSFPAADYTVASGIFNVRLDTPEPRWKDYVVEILAAIDRMSRRGFAFNMLTSYSDPERMRRDLYYADPCEVFDHCKRLFSKQVALLHDYGLYEFTIRVRK
jgi:SAM-dependent methyltransferase